MANRISIDLGTILKRSVHTGSVNESKKTDSTKLFTNLDSQIKSMSEQNRSQIGLFLKRPLISYLESLTNIEEANKHYREPLYFMQEFNKIDSSISDYILENYTSRILCLVDDLSQISETISRYNITEKQKNTILESAKKYITVDRILTNHERISKRFNISEEVNKIRGKDLKSVIESCCSMIDTYSVPSYTKMNTSFEEIGYLLLKNGVQYNGKDFVKEITEYFLLRNPNITEKDLKGYKTVLSENCFINESDLSSVRFVIDDPSKENSDTDRVSDFIKGFLLSSDKTPKSLEKLVREILEKCTVYDITYHTINIIWLIWDIFKSNLFEYEEMKAWIPILFQYISDYFSQNLNYSVNKDQVMQVWDDCKRVYNAISLVPDEIPNNSGIYVNFRCFLSDLIDNLKTLINVSYSQYNLKAIEFTNDDSVEPMPLNEYKIFKFHNLVKCCMNLDKYLKYKSKKIYSGGKKKIRHGIRKLKDILFDESTNIYEYIGEDCKVDICVAEFYLDENHLDESIEFFEEACKEFNEKMIHERMSDSIKCYYIINPGIAEIHLKESVAIKEDTIDWNMVKESETDYLNAYVEEFAYAQTCLEELDNMNEEFNFDTYFERFNHNPNMTLEHYELALEAMSLLEVNKEFIIVFCEAFKNHRYSDALLESVITEEEFAIETYEATKNANRWSKEENVPLDIQIEAIQILNAILEAPSINKNVPKGVKVNNNSKSVNNSVSKDDPNTKVDESRKNPMAGVNLNSMKLYLEGLKNKMKSMSSKEKEISRNLDNNFRRLVKNMKDALISDRREAIIKGSVIPSFSKCIKIAIGLAGTGLITGNPVVPLLIGIGGFATSKRLTKKERILLLDEIETELEVIEKEISIADSKNQIKKYRALLKYKKDLQRQYQRIRYNVRVGKDILPNSTAGIRGANN